MKKVWFILLLLLLIIGGVLFYLWSVKPSFNSRVLKDYNVLISCDIHNLRNTAIKQYFFQEDDESSVKDIFSQAGILRPNYLVAFSSPTVSNKLFSHQLIADRTKLNKFLQNREFEVSEEGFSGVTLHNKDNVTFAISESKEELIIVYNCSLSFWNNVVSGKSEFSKVILNLLNNKNILDIESSKEIDEIKSSTDHVTLVVKNKSLKDYASGSLFYDDNEIKVNGNFQFAHSVFPKEITSYSIIGKENSNISIGFPEFSDTNFYTQDLKDKILLLTNLSIDTIAQYYKPTVSISYLGYNTIQDSVLVYDYDENFELIEQKNIQEVVVPNIQVALNKKTEGGELYFKRDSLIKKVNGMDVFTPFPFYKLYTKDTNEFMLLSTNQFQLPIKKQSPFLEGKLNLKKLINDLQLFIDFDHKFKEIKSFECTVNQKDIVQFDGVIKLNNSVKSSLFYIINMLNVQSK